MAAISKTSPKPFLGSQITNVKVYSSKIDEIITKVNEISTHVQNHTGVAINTTATLTGAQLGTGYLTSTSVGTVSITLPTAAALLAVLPNCTTGSSFDFIVDNSAGANIVTVVASASIAVITSPVILGTNTLTVAAAKVGLFYIVFTSPTAAVLYRVG